MTQIDQIAQRALDKLTDQVLEDPAFQELAGSPEHDDDDAFYTRQGKLLNQVIGSMLVQVNQFSGS